MLEEVMKNSTEQQIKELCFNDKNITCTKMEITNCKQLAKSGHNYFNLTKSSTCATEFRLQTVT
jgi:hypothetical protein